MPPGNFDFTGIATSTFSLNAKNITTDIQLNKRVALRYLLLWKDHIQKEYLEKYNKETNKDGLRTISTFGGTRTVKIVDRGFELDLYIDASAFRSSKKTESEKWNGILHMSEYGETRGGSKKIRAKESKLLAIPINGTPRGASPREYKGVWVKTANNNVSLFIRNEGTKRSIKRGKLYKRIERTKGKRGHRPAPINRASRRIDQTDKSVLFIGVPFVRVRQKFKGFYKRSIEHIFGTGPGGGSVYDNLSSGFSSGVGGKDGPGIDPKSLAGKSLTHYMRRGLNLYKDQDIIWKGRDRE